MKVLSVKPVASRRRALRTWLQRYLTPNSVLLAARGAYDPEGGPITYLWEKTAGPAGSSLLYSNSASPLVTCLVNGTYSIRLTVTGNEGTTGTTTYTFTVNNNLPPVAGAWLQKYLTPTSVSPAEGVSLIRKVDLSLTCAKNRRTRARCWHMQTRRAR